MEWIEYTNETMTIDANGGPIASDCLSITFCNYGTNELIVNNNIRVPIPTVGQFTFITLEGQMNQLDRTKYVCKFNGAGTNDAIVVRRVPVKK